jgi:hypothetical protein
MTLLFAQEVFKFNKSNLKNSIPGAVSYKPELLKKFPTSAMPFLLIFEIIGETEKARSYLTLDP